MKDAWVDSDVTWIGHRGSPHHYPENTLEAYRAIFEGGGTHVETDVQLSADGIPFLFHDVDLERICGIEGSLFELDAESVRRLPASFPERFGERFKDLCITPLSGFASLMKQHPDTRAFVELKEESVERFGLEVFADSVLATLEDVISQCVLISFDADLVQQLQVMTDCKTGWVVPEWTESNREIAERLSPDWLFCNRKRLPDDNDDLWTGSWEWALYTVNDRETARALAERGFRHLETDYLLDLLNGTV